MGKNRYAVVANPSTNEVKVLDLKSIKIRVKDFGKWSGKFFKTFAITFLIGATGIAVDIIFQTGGTSLVVARWVNLFILIRMAFKAPVWILEGYVREGWKLIATTDNREEAIRIAEEVAEKGIPDDSDDTGSDASGAEAEPTANESQESTSEADPEAKREQSGEDEKTDGNGTEDSDKTEATVGSVDYRQF